MIKAFLAKVEAEIKIEGRLDKKPAAKDRTSASQERKSTGSKPPFRPTSPRGRGRKTAAREEYKISTDEEGSKNNTENEYYVAKPMELCKGSKASKETVEGTP